MVVCAGEGWGGWVLVCRVYFYNPLMVPHIIPWGNFNFPRSTKKLNFLTKFPLLEKLSI